MKLKTTLAAAAAILTVFAATAQKPVATLKIWDNATAPHSNGITTPETEKEPNRVRNTSEATLYIFPADKAKTTGQAVVICRAAATACWPWTTRATKWRNGSPPTASRAPC